LVASGSFTPPQKLPQKIRKSALQHNSYFNRKRGRNTIYWGCCPLKPTIPCEAPGKYDISGSNAIAGKRKSKIFPKNPALGHRSHSKAPQLYATIFTWFIPVQKVIAKESAPAQIALSMPQKIRIPTPLRKFTNDEAVVMVTAKTVAEVLQILQNRYTGFKEQLMDDAGNVRRFVNIYVNDEDIRFLNAEETLVKDGDEVSIVPAIAGGTC